MSSSNKVTVILGSQWGDEGKGKLSDILANKADICARCQGGDNAGHTIIANGKKFAVHILPSGIVSPNCIAVICNGVVLNIESLFKELGEIEAQGLDYTNRIFVSDRCQVVFNLHQLADGFNEQELGRGSIGTTKRGIGPAYSTKSLRTGIRVHELYSEPLFSERFRALVATMKKRYGDFDYDTEGELARYKALAEKMRPMVIDTVEYINNEINAGKNVLVEGANAHMLDIDFGTYPYVTSSNTGVGGALTGIGIPPAKVGNVIGVVKAYTTRVGGGPFPTEQLNDDGKLLQSEGAEFGVTTGRPRRCGWLDLVVVKYSTMVNGYTSINLTKLDVLDVMDEIKVATSYSINGKEVTSFPADLNSLNSATVNYTTFKGWKSKIANCTSFDQLPEACQAYVRFIEDFLGVPVEWIGTGAGRTDMIHIKK
ncbi:hypothetical protein BB560_001156 [Smittium megazygosporum]|uniref:Adenylosuccinate synthetase n=1 Tax=Smittium megazygosporum TaxID=133381 RepID=A0A2T9ZID2_9FUNG|nr:hypothetical protein BB560_001156 [Smittium megazygosporum]